MSLVIEATIYRYFGVWKSINITKSSLVIRNLKNRDAIHVNVN